MPTPPEEMHHLCTVCRVPVTNTGRHLWPENPQPADRFGVATPGHCAVCGSVKHTTYLTVYRTWFCREHHAQAQTLVHTEVPYLHRRLPRPFR